VYKIPYIGIQTTEQTKSLLACNTSKIVKHNFEKFDINCTLILVTLINDVYGIKFFQLF
jgi:hypothetical protein